MNGVLKNLPTRDSKPRENGVTMVMDKGLSLREAEDFLASSAEFTDMVKLGFGTSLITPNVHEKIALYQSAGIKTFLGGTLFEAFVARNQFDDYRKLIDEWEVQMAEVSDGSYVMSHDAKCHYIRKLSEQVTVLSEVGSKDADVEMPKNQWFEQMQLELEAGSWKVVAEARESGTVGIFQDSGKAKDQLVDEIAQHISIEKILWEAPMKSQQVWFIKRFGSNVNLGNIAVNEAIPLETLRLGLRGDTFSTFLDLNQ